MPSLKEMSEDYQAGYHAGYKCGLYARKRLKLEATGRWIWDPKSGEWHCSSCGTEFDQAHEEYCCKCGTKMSGEADINEDN